MPPRGYFMAWLVEILIDFTQLVADLSQLFTSVFHFRIQIEKKVPSVLAVSIEPTLRHICILCIKGVSELLGRIHHGACPLRRPTLMEGLYLLLDGLHDES